MASIINETALAVDAGRAWALLREVGAAHLAFPGVLRGCVREEDGVRRVTFADGTEIRERIVTVDDARRRVAYAVIGGRFAHHSASMRIFAEGPGHSRFVWVSDFLPDQAAAFVAPLVEQGAEAFRRAAEGGA